jgi:hypothetical protein
MPCLNNEGAITTYYNILELMWPARARLEFTTSRSRALPLSHHSFTMKYKKAYAVLSGVNINLPIHTISNTCIFHGRLGQGVDYNHNVIFLGVNAA